eukprot:TRINITY_DN5926_c0_g1_i6.p1 TRINITY_DN5926_c0_g1~~TRINITY_DN5926_c0_g1_i6.p1  ORF type:complete len:1145 (+),score=312.34 TRINITY_DN5926_c0_g1_i6:75-3509(+)
MVLGASRARTPSPVRSPAHLAPGSACTPRARGSAAKGPPLFGVGDRVMLGLGVRQRGGLAPGEVARVIRADLQHGLRQVSSPRGRAWVDIADLAPVPREECATPPLSPRAAAVELRVRSSAPPPPGPSAPSALDAAAAAAAAVVTAVEASLPAFGPWCGDLCPVCYDTLQRDTLEQTPCGHRFCSGCLERVRATRPLCPMCRHRIGEDPPRRDSNLGEIVDALLLLMLASPRGVRINVNPMVLEQRAQQQQQQQQALRQALPQHPAYDRPPAPPQRPQPPQGGDPKDSVGRPHMHPAQPQSQHQQQQHQQMRILRQQQFQQEQLGQHFRRQLQLLQEQEAGGSSALVQPPISTQQPQSMMLVQSLQILPLPQAGCFPVLAPAQPPQRSPTPPGSEYDKDCGAYEGLEEAVGSSSPVHTAAAPAQHHQPLPPAELGRALPTPAEAAAAEAELARRGGADGSSSGRQRPRHAAAKPAGPPVPLSGVIAPAAKTQQQRRSAREERRRSESLKEEKMALARKEMQQRMQLQQGRRDQETDRPPTCTDQPPATSDSQEEAGTDPSPTPLRRDQQRVQAPSCAPPSTSAASQKKKERRELGSAALPLPQQQHKPHQKHHQQQQQQQEQQEQQKLLQQNRRSSEETSSCASESNAPPEDEWATAVLWGKPAKAAAAPERPSRQKQGMPSKVAHKLLQQQQKHQKQLLRQQLREERELQVAQRARQCSGEAGAEQGAAPLATSADAEEAARPVPSPPPPEEPPQAGSPHPSPPPVPPPPSPPLPLPLSSPCDGTQVQRLKEPAPVPDSTEAIQRRQPSPPCTAELNPLASPHGMRSKRHALGDRPQLSMTFTDDGQRMGGILRVPLSPTIRHKQQQQRREAAPPADPSPGHADPHLFLEFLGAVCLVAVVGWPLRLLAIMVSMCRLMSRVKHPPTGIDYFTLLRGKIWHHMPENYGLWIIRALIEPDVLHPELLPFQDMAIVRGQIVKSTVRIPSPSPAPGVAKAEEESEAHAEPLGKGAPPGKWQAQRQLQRVGAGQHGAAPPAPDPAPQAAAQQAATPAPGPNRAAGNPAPPAPAASPAPATKPARAAFVQVPMGGRSAQSARSRAVAEDDNNMVMKLAHGAFLSCLVAFAAFGASAAFIGATDAGAAWE